MQRKAYIWTQGNLEIKLRTQSEDTIIFFVPAKGTKSLKESDINEYLRKFKNKSWKTFETYQKCKTRLWVVHFNLMDWEASCVVVPDSLRSTHVSIY